MAQILSSEMIFSAGFTAGLSIAVCAVSDPLTTTAADSVNVTQSVHRLAPISGMFADDPMWAEYLEAIKEIQEEDVG